MSEAYTVRMGERGRLVVPAEVRQRAGLREGTRLVLFDAPGGLVIMSRDQLRARVREDLAGLDLVGELLAERREDSAQDTV